MKKILALFFPTWSADLMARSRKEREIVLLTTEYRGKRLIARCCKTALQLGILPGMELVRAQALCPQGKVSPFEPNREMMSLKALSQWALRFSPIVAIDSSPDPLDTHHIGLFLDITGSERLFRGSIALMSKVQSELATLSLTSRMAIAPSVGGAWALSRYAPHNFLAVEREALVQTLSPLPIAALRLPPPTLTVLNELGIKTISHLLQLPRHTLAPRFGAHLGERLEQALGREEVLRAEHPPHVLLGEKSFASPLFSHEGVKECVHRLLRSLLERLDERQQALSSLKIELFLGNKTVFSRTLPLSVPTSEERHLLRLLDSRLESAPVEFGVEAIIVRAEKLTEKRAVQRGEFLDEKEPVNTKELGKLLDNLSQSALPPLRLTTVASHIPERAFRYLPFVRTAQDHRLLQEPPSPSPLVASDRPSLLFSPPQQITVIALLPDKPPTWLKWRGERFSIKKGIGPERITSEWWKSDEQEGTRDYSPRDYFKVQLSTGLWVWIFRRESLWFLHGVWS